MKTAHVMVGRLLDAKARGLPIPLINSWRSINDRSGTAFKKWFTNLVSGIHPLWMNGYEICPFCNTRLFTGGYMLEPIQFRDKQINIMIWHSYSHFMFDHGIRPAFAFFKALRNKDYASLIYAKECVRINKGQYIVL